MKTRLSSDVQNGAFFIFIICIDSFIEMKMSVCKQMLSVIIIESMPLFSVGVLTLHMKFLHYYAEVILKCREYQ